MAYLASSAAYAARQATATPTVTLGAAVSVGDIIVVYYGHDTSTSDTVPTDSLGNTYTFQGSPLTDANFNIHRVATARVTTGGTPTITLHLPGTPSAGAIMAAAYTGRATSSWVTDFDSAEQAAPSGTDSVTCPALTTSASDDVIYFLVGINGNLNVFDGGTGFTERLEQGGTPGVDFDVALTDSLNVSAGSVTPVGDTTDANRTCSFAISLANGVTADTGAVTLAQPSVAATGTTAPSTPTFDAASESHTGTTGSASEASFSWTHTPVGTPKGVLVFTFVNANADNATAVTYGGSALTAVSGGRAVDTATEPGDCKAWFLGSSIPTGAQTVAVTRTNNANVMYAVAFTVTADGDTVIAGTPVLLQNDQALTEQAVNAWSVAATRFAGVNSGLASIPGVGTNSTTGPSIDFGARVIQTAYETVPGLGSRSVGFTNATSDDVAAVHLAIGNATVAAATLPALQVSGSGSVSGSGGITGTAAVSIAALSVSGTGSQPVSGTAAVTIPALTGNGTGIRGNLGTASAPISALQVSASGTSGTTVTGTAAVTIPALTGNGTGIAGNIGTGSAPITALQVSGTGTNRITGTAALTVPALSVSGTGIAGNIGSGAVTIPVLSLGFGDNIRIPSLTVSGSGTVVTAVTGTGTAAIPVVQVSGAGIAGIIGTAALQIPALSVIGVSQGLTTGSGSVSIAALQVAGTAGQTQTATGTVTLPVLAVSGTGSQPVTGSAAVTIPALTGSGTGRQTHTGTAALSLPVLAIAGSGGIAGVVGGSASIALQVLGLSGTGTVGDVVSGTANVTLDDLRVRSVIATRALFPGKYKAEHASALVALEEAGQ